MQSKFGLVALGVIAPLALFGGDTAEAKSPSTDKKEVKKVVVTVKPGDTLSSIATKHKTTYVRIFNANKSISHPDVIDAGDKVRIPNKNEKLQNRMAAIAAPAPVAAAAPAAPAAVQQQAPQAATQPAPQQQPVQTQSYRGSSAGNTYGYGWCTWWAKEMRPDLPNGLGNGGEWAANAAAQGIATGYVARAGAIAEIPGHVAYVKSVSSDGRTMAISEMGWNYQQGQFNERTVSTSGWRFIY